ncbi:hypothetical protein GALL_357770 [mine drainage metagenome]|jgi:hypothetical protein|uniref:Uncharacterized protein n=1 Tax=mine drainage metagenome TaxID=410659 RepID=A0A1J5QRB6_9ZZZZ
MKTNRVVSRPLVLALATCAALTACGGGGGAAGTTSSLSTAQLTSLRGTAVDAPIAGAQITITAGAPSGDAGATVIGTVTADATGAFTTQVTLPSGSVPVFANATDPSNATVVLSSYLGQSDALAAAGTLTSNNLPDLDISPVTTAALAVYAQINGGYTKLTPAAYASTLQTYGSDVLAIAAAIKAVGDTLCTPSATITTTTNLAAAIAQAANLSSSTSVTLSAAITALGGNCAGVLAGLPSAISADPVFGPELDLGDVIDAGATVVPAGTYTLQGVIAQTGFSATPSQLSSTLTTPAAVSAADVFSDTAVTVSSNGAVTSTDGNVSGSVVGNLLTLTLLDPTTQTTYTLRGKIGSMPTAMTGGAQAYAVRSGGTYTANGSSMLAKFNAVLAPAAASAAWGGVTPPSSPTRTEGVSCAAGSFPLRLDVFAARDGGGSIGECVTPGATSWTLSAPTATNQGDDFSFNGQSGLSTAAPTLSAASWTQTSSAPYVLSAANASVTVNGTTTTGTLYYVMGSQTVVITGTSGSNVLLHMHGNALTQVSEAANNGGDANLSGSGMMGDGAGSTHQSDH